MIIYQAIQSNPLHLRIEMEMLSNMGKGDQFNKIPTITIREKKRKVRDLERKVGDSGRMDGSWMMIYE